MLRSCKYPGEPEPSSFWGSERLYWQGYSWAEPFEADSHLLSKRKRGRRWGILEKGWGSQDSLSLFGNYSLHSLPLCIVSFPLSSWVWPQDLLLLVALSRCKVRRGLKYACLVWLGSPALMNSHEKCKDQVVTEAKNKHMWGWSIFKSKLQLKAHTSFKPILTHGSKIRLNLQTHKQGMVVTWHYWGNIWQLHLARLTHGLGTMSHSARGISKASSWRALCYRKMLRLYLS